jgi:hypothetical protein
MIISDIKTEIVGGSNITQPAGQMPVYQPSSAQNVVPSRALANGSMLTDPIFNSLIKQSSGSFFQGGYTTTPLITGSTGRDTSVASANNRIVSATRWNAPVLNTSSGFSAATQLPQWILVDRQGIAPSQSWSGALRDYTPGSDQAVIGRFAFNVYDIGGLLDANVAGYPIFSTALTNAQIQQLKSSLAGAYLFDASGSIMPGFDSAKQQMFVNTWKFPTAGVSSSTNFFLDFMRYPNTPITTLPVTFSDTGFMRAIARGSNSTTIAYSRQDLIRANQTSNAYLTSAALPFFTHFNRELNAPSWFPSQNAQDIGGNNGPGNLFAYFTKRDDPSASNRFLPNVRVATAFVRADGTTAVAGEPLMKYRFPLRRLSGIGSTGVNTNGFPVMVPDTSQTRPAAKLQAPSAATVQRDFGLVWDNSNDPVTGQAVNRWNYVGPTGISIQSSIATLDQVATAGREPNFFEILKAFILSGSVGLGSGSANTFATSELKFYVTGTTPTNSLSSDSQICQIGANIIDQWDGDKNPTFIYFGTDEFAGVENLPYLNKIGFQARWTSSTAFTAFLGPSFWTPPQNAAPINTSTTSPTTTTPIVRFVMTSGTASAVVEGNSGAISAQSAIVAGSAAQPSVNLTNSANFGSPDAASSGTSVKAGMVSNGNSRLGIQFTFSAMNGVARANTSRAYPILNNATFAMQAQLGSPSGPWKTYQRWLGCSVNSSGGTAAFQPPAGFDWTVATIFDPEFVVLDPRTLRFGAWESDGHATGDTTDYNRGWNETVDRGGSSGFQGITGMGPQGSHFSGTGVGMANNAAAPNYTDLDGVRRSGDALNSGDTSGVIIANSADRSPILSREIKTVAELGTVFRDQPWKTLNFTTADSADAGLLDAFSIFEPNTVFRSDLMAGKISLNTKQTAVLRAVLAGVATNTNNSTPLIDTTSPAQRNAVADALVAMTAIQPMINKSELVTRFAADPTVTVLGSKEAREAVIRALADVGQTRTWNLMIDVIAQVGRYGATASGVDDFIVQGEKRYWLHIAMDRFTGEIIDQQLEAVNE